MDIQTILAVDDNGNFLGYIPKELGHKGEGKRHLAIAVLVFNSKGQVLLQKRKHKIFDNIWDITGATHPLHKENSSDESLEEATLRCLETEWEISPSASLRVKEIGVFNYFAKDKDYCENEHCFLLIGEYDGEIKMDEKTGYEYKWMSKEEFIKDIREKPEKYTPWAKESVKILLDKDLNK